MRDEGEGKEKGEKRVEKEKCREERRLSSALAV